MFRRGFYGVGSCFGTGFGYMNGGRNIIALAVFIVLAIAVIIYFSRKTKNKNIYYAALEELKKKFSKG